MRTMKHPCANFGRRPTALMQGCFSRGAAGLSLLSAHMLVWSLRALLLAQLVSFAIGGG